MAYTITLKLEPYLSQWLIHRFGGKEPVQFPRGSVEHIFLQKYLRKPPADYRPSPRTPNTISVFVPWFKGKDVRRDNYLSPTACIGLKTLIRRRFIFELWDEVLYTIMCPSAKNISQQENIEAFMRNHHIICDDTNYNTVYKIFYRQKRVYNRKTIRTST